MLAQELSGRAIFFFRNRQQEMFGRDELVLHLLSAFLRRSENLRESRTKILLTALHARETSNRGFAIILDDLNVGPEFAQQRTYNTLGLVEHRAKNMFRLDLLMLIALREFYPRLNRFLSA